MKKDETNKTYKNIGMALSEKDLDPVSGGMMYRPGSNQQQVVDIVFCNNCDQDLGEIWEGEDCPIKDNTICRWCGKPIRLNQCRIEQRVLTQGRLL